MMDGKFVKACQNKWQKKGMMTNCDKSCCCCKWTIWPFVKEENTSSIPRDVPKGHLVVYVGKYQKRFVIKVNLLKHPLFKALLDQAQEEIYDDFTHVESKLWIPCDENVFVSVMRCATSPKNRRRISILCF
ncbi:hypothetical protein HAX54_048629 [Datura stramonium]|uniref:Uncharacterized protein n=1 Tax=Datura stramonium TaxID=4076 RepID=A0ABS8WP68_DATST|nr:hypothetical protein [Datura stramonium]